MNSPQKLFDQAIEELCEGEAASPQWLEKLAGLIGAGANPSALTIPVERDGSGGETSALIVAAARNWDEVVSLFLLDEGLDVNVMDVDGEHALFAALKNGQKASAKLLLARSNVWRLEESGASCLSIAIRSGLAEEAEEIVERMREAERKEELKEMREQISDGNSTVCRQDLEERMLGLLLSKIERGILAGATESGADAPLKKNQGPRSL